MGGQRDCAASRVDGVDCRRVSGRVSGRVEGTNARKSEVSRQVRTSPGTREESSSWPGRVRSILRPGDDMMGGQVAVKAVCSQRSYVLGAAGGQRGCSVGRGTQAQR